MIVLLSPRFDLRSECTFLNRVSSCSPACAMCGHDNYDAMTHVLYGLPELVKVQKILTERGSGEPSTDVLTLPPPKPTIVKREPSHDIIDQADVVKDQVHLLTGAYGSCAVATRVSC